MPKGNHKYALNGVESNARSGQNSVVMGGRYQKQNYNSNNQSNLSANLISSLNFQGGAPDNTNPNIKRINNIQLPGLNHSGSAERINYSNRPAQKY